MQTKHIIYGEDSEDPGGTHALGLFIFHFSIEFEYSLPGSNTSATRFVLVFIQC